MKSATAQTNSRGRTTTAGRSVATKRLRLCAGLGVGLSVLLPLVSPAPAGAIGPGTLVAGTTFRDLNADGTMNGAEQPLGGIFISATGQVAGPDTLLNTDDDVITTYGPVVSNAAGTWSINGVLSDTTIRVEAVGYDANGNLTLDGSEAQLPTWLKTTFRGSDNGTTVQFVATGSAGAVKFGFANPADFCQATPSLATTCFVNGDTTGNTVDSALYNLPSSGGSATGIVEAGNQGAAYGVAYNRATKQTITSAYVKRHAGLGPQGIGGIYAVDGATGTPAWSIDVSGMGATVGSIGSNAARGLAGKTDASTDLEAFAKVGRAGIGDIEVGEDNSTIWFTSFGDGALYSLPLPADGTAPTGPATPHSITSVCDRPMAVAPHDGKIYVGVACSDATQAEIVAFDPNTATWTSIMLFPLTYTKGCSVATLTGTTACNWNAWTDTYNAGTMEFGSDYIVAAHPEPMFSDLVFDNDGSIVVGLRDRFGDQVGHRNNRPDGVFPANHGITGVSGGDVLRICNVSGSLVMQGGVGCSNNLANNQGPGGGEFYQHDDYVRTAVVRHQETSFGGLAIVPGGSNVYVTSMDPAAEWDAGGVEQFSNTNGAEGTPTEIYQNGADHPSTFGKSNGIGDIEALCDLAPVQIGNRVWVDSNRNGVQDPAEPPVIGATVTLYNYPANTVVDSAVTNSSGEYYFSSTTYPVITTGAQFTLGVPTSVTVDGTNTVTGSGTSMSLTTQSGTADPLGSDAVPGTGRTVPITIGGPGANDHTWDFGYIVPLPTIDLAVTKTLKTPGTVHPGDTVTFGVTVTNNGPAATTRAFSVIDHLPAGLTPVSATGTGFACAAPVGQDITCEQSPFAALAAAGSAAEITVTATVDSGISGTPQNLVKVVPGAGELTETNPLGSTNSGYETGDPGVGSNNDASASVTVTPLVPTPLYSLGNRVWFDANDNSMIDSGETGIANASVELLNSVGGTISTVATDSSGFYRFDGLAAGTYSVRVTAPTGYISSTLDSTNPDDDTDATASVASDNGIGSANIATSGTVTLGGSPAEPVGETDLVAGADPQGGVDDRGNMTVDFGFYQPSPVLASLGDTVWYDDNGNGVQDPGESGVAGVTVKLYEGVTSVATTVTDSSGRYRFDGLTPGVSYVVEFVPTTLPVGYTFTAPLTGTEANDSNADTTTGRTKVYVLAASEHNPTVDAGIVRIPGVPPVTTPPFIPLTPPTTVPPTTTPVPPTTTPPTPPTTVAPAPVVVPAPIETIVPTTIAMPGCAVGDQVFVDRNLNGERDANEPGIARARVVLTLPDGSTRTLVTDEDGTYLYEELQPGVYTVEVLASTEPSNGPRVRTVNVCESGDSLDNDFGFSNLSARGVQLSTEPGLALTGGDPWGTVVAAVSMILVGFALTGIRRRRISRP